MTALLSLRRKRSANAAVEDGFLFQIPLAAHQLPGFRDWAKTIPEKVKIALVAGEVYIDTSNEDIERHVSVKGVIFATLYHLVKHEGLGQVFQDGGLLTNDAAELASNPDALAVLWKTLESGKLKIVAEDDHSSEFQGTPDWVLEVVSPSSVAKDTRHLRHAYHAARIPEYWLVVARRHLSFTILHWRKSGYAAAVDENGWLWSKVFGRYFRLRLEIHRGVRDYILEASPKAH